MLNEVVHKTSRFAFRQLAVGLASILISCIPNPSLGQGVEGPPPGFVDAPLPNPFPQVWHQGAIEQNNYHVFEKLIESHGAKVTGPERKQLCTAQDLPCGSRFALIKSSHFSGIYFGFQFGFFNLTSFYMLSSDRLLQEIQVPRGQKLAFTYSFPEDRLKKCEGNSNFMASLIVADSIEYKHILISVGGYPECNGGKTYTLDSRDVGGPFDFVSEDRSTGFKSYP